MTENTTVPEKPARTTLRDALRQIWDEVAAQFAIDRTGITRRDVPARAKAAAWAAIAGIYLVDATTIGNRLVTNLAPRGRRLTAGRGAAATRLKTSSRRTPGAAAGSFSSAYEGLRCRGFPTCCVLPVSSIRNSPRISRKRSSRYRSDFRSV